MMGSGDVAGRARFAGLAFSLCAVATFAQIGLALGYGRPLPPGFEPATLIEDFGFLLFPLVGALIASRRPENPLGWGLLIAGVISVMGDAAGWYGPYAFFVSSKSLTGGGLAAWLHAVLWMPSLLGLPLLFLLFPDGHLPSPRWIWVARAVGIPAGLLLGPVAWFMWRFRGLELLLDPDGMQRLQVADGYFGAGMAGLLLLTLLASFSLIGRFRKTSWEQRQQIKWLAAAGVLLFADGMVDVYLWPDRSGILSEIWGTAVFAFVPIAIGVAILKYRLYDIDVIINRALVYGSLSAILGLAYVSGVVVFGEAVRSVTGQTGNNFAVAASTLAVAALFRPARFRIQSFIDRRFYRRRYDAGRTVEAFSARLRDEVELSALSDDLLAAVRDTVQPAHVSLWLSTAEQGL